MCPWNIHILSCHPNGWFLQGSWARLAYIRFPEREWQHDEDYFHFSSFTRSAWISADLRYYRSMQPIGMNKGGQPDKMHIFFSITQTILRLQDEEGNKLPLATGLKPLEGYAWKVDAEEDVQTFSRHQMDLKKVKSNLKLRTLFKTWATSTKLYLVFPPDACFSHLRPSASASSDPGTYEAHLSPLQRAKLITDYLLQKCDD